jgi:hypothetical protein
VGADGSVVLCVTKGQIVFADRCAGSGRLSIVQPIKEGPVAWRTAVGKVEPPKDRCSLSRATWEKAGERAVASEKRVRLVPATELSGEKFPVSADLKRGEFTGFALDLDNDGEEDFVFAFDNTQLVAAEHEKTGKPAPYLVAGGFASATSTLYPSFFQFESGTYQGGTDTIGHVRLIGIVQIDAGSREIAVLVQAGTDYKLDLIRFRSDVQRIQTIARLCD